MELYRYKCPACGFMHQVPGYWVNFAPDSEMDFIHFRIDTGEECESKTLHLQSE